MTSPMIVVVGATASGKSELALRLAEQFNGSLICADSRTIYRGIDIGTAKPSSLDRQRIQHYCLDLVDPDQQFTAADFKRHALQAIEQITAAGKLPILVGGTGLYIDAVIYDYQFRMPADPALRQELNGLSVDELQSRALEQAIELPANSRNPRHLIRALETGGEAAVHRPLRPGTLVIGLEQDPQTLRQRIAERVAAMCQQGLEAEAGQLADKYGWDVPPMQTIGYQEWQPCFGGEQSREQTVDEIIGHTLQYAKRQRTWFRRNKSIHWLSPEEKLNKSVELVTTLLNK